MKVLRRTVSGYIVYENFDGVTINSPLINRASLTNGVGYVSMTAGGIVINASLFDNVVFEVLNDFVPLSDGDMGGIAIVRGDEKREFYEYYNPIDNEGTIPYVRIKKVGDVYTGYHSQNGIIWEDKGYVILNGADTIGVYAESSVPYRLDYIKVYKSEYVTIQQLMPGWHVEVFDTEEYRWVSEPVFTNDIVTFILPSYPFTGKFKVFNEVNELISEVELTDVWGGDCYLCTCNVDLYDKDGITPLNYESVRHIGAMVGGIIEDWFTARNNSDIETTVTIRACDYSPFGKWVLLSKDENGVPNEYKESIDITLAPNSDADFWIHVERDNSMIDFTFDFQKTECSFYLEVL